MTDTIKRPSATRIAIWSWRNLFVGVVRMAPLFATTIVLWLATGLALEWLQGLILPGTNEAWVEATKGGPMPWKMLLISFPFEIISLVISAVVLAPVAVAMHRFVLLDEVRRHYAITPTSLYFAGWLAAFQFLQWMQGILSYVLLTHGLRAWNTPITLIWWTVVLWTMLLFPPLALDEKAAGILNRLETALERTKGNFWWILRASFLTFCWPLLLAVVVVFLFNLSLPQVGQPVSQIEIDKWAARLNSWPYMLGFSAFYTLLVSLAAAMASLLFRHARKKAINTAITP